MSKELGNEIWNQSGYIRHWWRAIRLQGGLFAEEGTLREKANTCLRVSGGRIWRSDLHKHKPSLSGPGPCAQVPWPPPHLETWRVLMQDWSRCQGGKYSHICPGWPYCMHMSFCVCVHGCVCVCLCVNIQRQSDSLHEEAGLLSAQTRQIKFWLSV